MSNIANFSILIFVCEMFNRVSAVANYSLNKRICTKLGFSCGQLLSKNMSLWETEKSKFLSMGLEEKRKLYRGSTFYKLEEILTWPQYAEKHSPLPEKIPLLTTNQINVSHNAELAKKISIFRGDITSLEVNPNFYSLSQN